MAASTDALTSVIQLLKGNLGALRILFNEAGLKVMAPATEDIYRDITERWPALSAEEKVALRSLLESVEVRGRKVVEYQALLRALKRPPAMHRLVSVNPLESPRARNVQRDFRMQLDRIATSTGMVLLQQFTRVLRDFDSGADAVDAKALFAEAAAGGAEGKVAVDALVKVAAPRITLARQKGHNSDMVRDALLWDRPPPPPPQVAASPRGGSSRPVAAKGAPTTTRAVELRKQCLQLQQQVQQRLEGREKGIPVGCSSGTSPLRVHLSPRRPKLSDE